MIVELLVGLLVKIVKGFASLFGDASAPGWMTSFADEWQTIMNVGASLSQWVPWPFMTGVALSVISCVVVGFTIKVVRIVASFLTAGGGSAA